MSLSLSLEPASLTLAPTQGPQLCYILVTVTPPHHGLSKKSVNWALVADASLSMRIPIVSEEQFRKMAREGGAHEVLVDGMPVWKMSGPLPQEIRDEAPGALDYVARALHSIVEQLDNEDRFTLVAYAEDAVTLVQCTSGAHRAELVKGINQLKEIDLGEATELAAGLQLGLAELEFGGRRDLIERLLLLTDGFTQNHEACLKLARQAASSGIAVSTIGLGADFQADLLTTLADLSGGQAYFLRKAHEIPPVIAEELAAARQVAARTVGLTLTLSQGVRVRRTTRISPTLALLEMDYPTPRVCRLNLGDLEHDTPTRILLEVVVPPAPRLVASSAAAKREHQMRLAQVALTTGLQPDPRHPAASCDAIATFTPRPAPMLPAIRDATARASTAYLQRAAFNAVTRGERGRAAVMLRTVAQRLRELGEPEMAEIAQHEADSLAQTGKTTQLGTKELTYATRRLGQ